MKGWLQAGVALGVLAAGLGGGAFGQDKVEYKDPAAKGKRASIDGTIEEEATAGVTVKGRIDGRGAVVTKQVLADDIVAIVYKSDAVPAVDFRRGDGKLDLALRAATPAERGKLLKEALAEFEKVEPRLKGEIAARRYILYRIALVRFLQAQDASAGEGAGAARDAALKSLGQYVEDAPKGWQIVSALKMLGKLQEDAGRPDDARATYERLADVPGVPAATKQESEVLVARLYLRGDKPQPKEALKRLTALAKGVKKGDPQWAYVQAYLAATQLELGETKGVEATLRGAVAAGADGKLKALAHNVLGDYYRAKGQGEDAFWEYLRVDAMYADDVEEHAKALYHLRALYDKVKNDPVRAKKCAAALLGAKFRGTRHQRLALAEKK